MSTKPVVAMCDVGGRIVTVSCEPNEVDLNTVTITNLNLARRALRAHLDAFGATNVKAENVKLVSVLDKNTKEWSNAPLEMP
jgi:hypothetical protein